MRHKLQVAVAFFAGAAISATAVAAASGSTGPYLHMLGILDEARAPAVGVRCQVGKTPDDYRPILQSRYSLRCAQDDGSASSAIVLFFSDSGVVVQRGAPSYRAIYKHSDP